MKNLVVALLVVVVAGAAGAWYFLKNTAVEPQKETVPPVVAAKPEPVKMSAVQQELEQLAAKTVQDLQQESRVNLNLFGQMRAQQETLKAIQAYSAKVQKQIDVIEELSKDEFQEDVKLQASLFNGKKSDMVAKHLEEFRASRVGAILAKMKEKEASAVLDIWAESQDPKVAAFYRETMTAYLANKRHDMHPEALKGLQEATASQNTAPIKKEATSR